MPLTKDNFYLLNQLIDVDLQMALREQADVGSKFTLLTTILKKLAIQDYSLNREDDSDPLQTNDCFAVTRELFADPTKLTGQLTIPKEQAESAKVAILISLYLLTFKELTELRQKNPANDQEKVNEAQIGQLAKAEFDRRLGQLTLNVPKSWLIKFGFIGDGAARILERHHICYGALVTLPVVTMGTIIAARTLAGRQFNEAEQAQWDEWAYQMLRWGRYISSGWKIFALFLVMLTFVFQGPQRQEEQRVVIEATPDMLRQILADAKSKTPEPEIAESEIAESEEPLGLRR